VLCSCVVGACPRLGIGTLPRVPGLPLPWLRLFQPMCRLVSMTSSDDARLKILNHMVEYFMLFDDDEMDEADVDDIVDEHQYLASVLLESMGMEVLPTTDGKINVSFDLQDVDTFIEAKLAAEETFVEDSTS